MKHPYLILLIFVIHLSSQSAFGIIIQQDTIEIKASDKAEQLLKSRDYKKVLKFTDTKLKQLLSEQEKDSTEISWLSYYKFEALFQFGDYFKSKQAAELGISYCKQNEEGLHKKAVLFYKKAYAESQLNLRKQSQKSMLKSVSLLSELEFPNYDYIIGAYNFLSQNEAYYGNLKEALRYLRLSENTYRENKTLLDKIRTDANGNYDRYDVILAYKNIYTLYKRGQTKSDSLYLLKNMKRLDSLHKKPDFNTKYESIYLTTALNHTGTWYLEKNENDSVSKSDLSQANFYMDRSIKYVEDDNYPGNLITFKFNKCKALTLENKLDEADRLIAELLKELPDKDKRKSAFLAQKGVIKTKKQQKDSALVAFFQALKTVHSGKDSLQKDFKNFVPSQVFGETKLIYKIAEKLRKNYESEPDIQKKLAQLYYMAFLQFENSYLDTTYNKNYDKLLRQIFKGILQMKMKYGYNVLEDKELLNRTEVIQNKLSWQNFYQNRYSNNLADLDSLKPVKLQLKSEIATAKLNNEVRSIDSLQQALKLLNIKIEKEFPNLDMLTAEEFDVNTLQNRLGSNQLALKYVMLENQIAIFSIYKDGIEVSMKNWTEVENTTFQKFIEDNKNKAYNENLAGELALILIPNIKPEIEQITINPDGELYQLAFEILRINGKFLCQNYAVGYTSSLALIYPELNDSSNSELNELAIYLPSYSGEVYASEYRSGASILEGAKAEAEEISKLFTSSIYSRQDLSKEDFISTSKDAKLIHLAMHAEVNNEEPGLSRLIFDDTQDDKNLYLEEIYGLSLNSDLAVLSACNTGVGKSSANQSMESFQRAFSFAGVPATVASLWQVPDQSTNQIMQGFYLYLSQGDSKSKALQKAKSDFVDKYKGTKLAEPFYWAGFVIYGTDRPIKHEDSVSLWILLTGAFIFIVFFMSYFIKNLNSKMAGKN
jgi:CHAT domain-containing protein